MNPNEDGWFRAHWTIIIVNSISFLIVLLLFRFWTRGIFEENSELYMYANLATLGLLAAAIFYPWRWWRLTHYRLTPNGLEKKRETWFRLDKTVPYGKIASVNLKRMIFNRILGTSIVEVHANSGPSAIVAEAQIYLKAEDAERLRAELNARISGEIKEDVFQDKVEAEFESLLKFTAKDSIIQGIFGVPTSNLLASFFFLFPTAISFFTDSQEVAWTFMLIVLFSYLVPVVATILKYYDFGVRRIGDTIHIKHGAIRNYASSFETVKVNAIRVRKPFFARIIGKSCIEAEVVGMGEEMDTPLLCLMVKDSVIPDVIAELVPEFAENTDSRRQPPKARLVLFLEAVISTAILAPIVYLAANSIVTFINEFVAFPLFFDFMPLAFAGLVALWLFYWMHRRFQIETLALGEETMTVVGGVVDRVRVTMMYDRVQIVEARSNPLSLPFGLSRCSFSMLSSKGAVKEKSGYFETEMLENIGDILVERIKSGKRSYSYKSF